MHVLVVDDDARLRDLVCTLLTGAGFSCEPSATAEEARRRIDARPPDVVLLDVHLPGESGLSLARDLVQRHPGLAVVMVSGADDAEVARIALDAGAYGYVTKPFKRNELTIAVENALRRRRHELESRTRRAMLEERVIERTAAAQDALARLRVAHEETVHTLAKAVEYRDPETGSHIERMSRYCALLAARFDLDPDTIGVVSRLHDVGKIAVADSILLKPGPLTSEEREEMQRHAEIGHHLLQGSRSELLEVAATIAWTHHERFDGDGYPRGLAGEEIPLVGRIAALADVFDALTTDRLYRPAIPFAQSVATLEAERGRHFDPDVLDGFLADIDEVSAILRRYDGDRTERPEPAEDADGRDELITLADASATLGVSPSTLRRWADAGRIPAVRTVGGHRRFPLEALRRFAAEAGAGPAVRPIGPPIERLPALAERVAIDGPRLAAAAAGSLYRGYGSGWFASGEAAPAIREWLAEIGRGSSTGDFAAALAASGDLMRRAHLQGAPLLERHSFLDRFRDAAVRSLSQAGAPQAELAGARRLVAALQQSMLDEHS